VIGFIGVVFVVMLFIGNIEFEIYLGWFGGVFGIVVW